MIPPPKHIQDALDREFPGVKLQWNAHLGFWVLTDWYWNVDGTRMSQGYRSVPRAMQGIEPYPYTQRALIWVIGDIQTGERWPVIHEGILNALRKAHRGTRPEQIEEMLDMVEASENAAEEREKKAERERARDSAETVWNGLKRSTFGAGVRRTPWTFSKALDKEYARRELERTEDAEHELDQIVAEEAAAGRTTMLHEATIGRHGANR